MNSVLSLDNNNLQEPQQFFKNHNQRHLLKWTSIQFLVSITLVSLFLCFSSGFSLLPNSLYVYFNTCLLSFLTQTLERKYMFLICNGILALLAKNANFSIPQSDLDHNTHLSSPSLPALNPTINEVPEEIIGMEPAEVIDLDDHDEEEETNDNNQEEVENKEEKGNMLIEKSEVKEVKEEKEGNFENLTNETLEEEEEEEIREVNNYYNYEEMASTEELNRRFEEFIRKMKEEIRIEAQRTLITV